MRRQILGIPAFSAVFVLVLLMVTSLGAAQVIGGRGD